MIVVGMKGKMGNYCKYYSGNFQAESFAENFISELPSWNLTKNAKLKLPVLELS